MSSCRGDLFHRINCYSVLLCLFVCLFSMKKRACYFIFSSFDASISRAEDTYQLRGYSVLWVLQRLLGSSLPSFLPRGKRTDFPELG